MKFLGLLNQYFKPLILVGSALVYFLGVGLARYLGSGVNWSSFGVGLGWITALQIGAFFLYEYFKPPELTDYSQNNNGRQGNPETRFSQRTVLLVAYTCMAVVASLTVLLIAERRSDPVIFLIMALLFTGCIFYSAPPFQLEFSGYGELVLAFMLGFLVPGFSFILQANQLHRLVAMTTFPLVFVSLAMFIALQFPGFASALKFDRRNLLIRMGWRRAMNLHNLLILGGYLLIGLASFFGLPSFVVIAAALTLPFAILEIWQFYRIGQGGRPNWRLLSLNALATFGSLAYLMAYSYWTH
jgi:1,4-dihydroxy-2-naphthoate octaprenyltransferase